MKFIDSVKVFAKSGDGGSGCVSMRHEKYLEFGGPDGGDGGKGGDVIISGSSNINSLLDLKYHPHQKAGKGQPGMGSQKTGKSGKDRIVFVPLGTVIMNEENKEIFFEVLEEKQYLLLKGGRGGKGNRHFRTSTNRTPRFAQPGEKGAEMTVRFELKLIADVGLIGLPNAGKSTLISVISNATPKIDDYPFTTVTPNLGVVQFNKFETFVVADIPGIIQNAHLGVGLGDRFLKHIQRTVVLAFLIDISGESEQSPIETFQLLCNELFQYSPDLLKKKRIVLLTKTDTVAQKTDLNQIINDLRSLGELVFPISSVANKGISKAVNHLGAMVNKERTMTSPSNQKGE